MKVNMRVFAGYPADQMMRFFHSILSFIKSISSAGFHICTRQLKKSKLTQNNRHRLIFGISHTVQWERCNTAVQVHVRSADLCTHSSSDEVSSANSNSSESGGRVMSSPSK